MSQNIKDIWLLKFYPHPSFNKGIGCVVEKGCSNGKIFGAFNKEGHDFSYHGYHVNWKKGRRGGDGKATKAFIEERSVLRGDDPVWRRSDVYGSSVKDGRDNSIVVRKHNICRRPKRSVLPRSLEEKNSPLHVTKIEPMLISFVKERMSQKRLKRFEFVWDLTFFHIKFATIPDPLIRLFLMLLHLISILNSIMC